MQGGITWLNWPNRITIARIVLVVPFVICLLNVAGGAPVMVCDLSGSDRGEGGTWDPDDHILFTVGDAKGVMQVPARGGVPTAYMVPDTRAAWVGATPGTPEGDLRVEAGAIEGRPVFFKLLDRSGTKRLGEEPSTWTGFGLGQLWEPGLTMLLILAACLLARRNLQKGRADRRGAIILSTFGFIAMCIHEGLRSHCLYNTHSLWELNRVLGSAVFMAIVVG